MIALDTSVVVAALVRAHPRHETTLTVIDGDCVLPAHAALETYAVLTRAPLPLRTPPEAVSQMLRGAFEGRIVQLGKSEVLPLLERMAAAGVRGRAIYDASIAETARRAGATLVTEDRKAAPIYAAVGVEVEYL